MSWFNFGTPSKLSKRKNVYLRTQSLPKDLQERAAKHYIGLGQPYIERVLVKEIKTPQVLLEFWVQDLEYKMKEPLLPRYIVFYLIADPNPEWVCEGNYGRGYVA